MAAELAGVSREASRAGRLLGLGQWHSITLECPDAHFVLVQPDRRDRASRGAGAFAPDRAGGAGGGACGARGEEPGWSGSSDRRPGGARAGDPGRGSARRAGRLRRRRARRRRAAHGRCGRPRRGRAGREPGRPAGAHRARPRAASTPEFVQLRAERGSILAAPGRADLVLVAVVGPDANVGLARLEMLDAASRLG